MKKKHFTLTVNPKKGDVNTVFTFCTSLDSEYESGGYVLEFGDGASIVQNSLDSVKHTYQKPGNYTAKCSCEYYAKNSQQDYYVIEYVHVTVAESPHKNNQCKQLETQDEQTVSFSFSPTAPMAGANVQFVANAPDYSTSSTYTWDFGDGKTGTGNKANHAYSHEGKFTVTLVVKDTNGKTGSCSKTVSVMGP